MTPAPLITLLDVTDYEYRLLQRLAETDLATHDSLRATLYGDQIRCDACIKVLMCRLRKKLKPHGIRIKSERTKGYMIPQDDKQRLYEIMKEAA